MGFRRIVSVVASALGVGAAVVLVSPYMAGGAEVGAVCHASNGSTSYSFSGTGDFQPTASAWDLNYYTASFSASDSQNPANIPSAAKNDVRVELRKYSPAEVIYSTHSPDAIWYGPPAYQEDLSGWTFPDNQYVFVRFGPAFDKRGTPDASCTADTPLFAGTHDAPGGGVSTSFICDKAPAGCQVIFPPD